MIEIDKLIESSGPSTELRNETTDQNQPQKPRPTFERRANTQSTKKEAVNLHRLKNCKSRTTRRWCSECGQQNDLEIKCPYRVMPDKGRCCSRQCTIPQRAHAVNFNLHGRISSATTKQSVAEQCNQGNEHTLVLKILIPDFPCVCIVVLTVSIGV